MKTVLIICEKPDAALHIAEALDDLGKPIRLSKNKVPYYIAKNHNEEIIVCSALGHLYEVDAKDSSSKHFYPVWDFVWKPKYLVERGQKRQETWIKVINELSKKADDFINACDYDIEGSLIGYMILKYACGGVDLKAKRMKFSTLTKKELREAYKNLMNKLDYPLINAGMCRHEVDWIYGINLSRALTLSAYKHSKKYTTLSTGRVQGPTLRFVVEKEKEITTFVPSPYWSINAEVKIGNQKFEAEFESKKIENILDAHRIAKACNKEFGEIIDIHSKKIRLYPPNPFDLTSLQAEAYRHFGFTPAQTVAIAERLYLNALISYPRTSSQKLPPSIGYEEILKNISSLDEYKELSKKLLSIKDLKPNEGKKTDPAHPAIYPTGEKPKGLSERERKLFDLIVKRFMATFGEPAIKQSEKIIINVNNYKFYVRGSRLIEDGWTRFYSPYIKLEEAILPKVSLGEKVLFLNVKVEEKFSQPPARYNPSSLLKVMEQENIGTKTTRAEIIDTLYQRGYVKGERMIATPLAFKIIEVLLKYCPKVIDVSFTRELESKMEEIELGNERRERVLLEAIEYLKPIIYSIKEKEVEIGKELSETIKEMRLSEIKLNTPCPKCESTLFILRSRKTGKRFIGCSNALKGECDFALPLPQFGKITLMDKYCQTCGFQLIQVKVKNRRPMITCAYCYVNKKA